MTTVKTQPTAENMAVFPALSQTLLHFSQSTQERIAQNREKGIKDSAIFDFLNRIPHLCQEILETSYEDGITFLFDTFRQLEHGTVRSIISDFTLRNLDGLEKTDSQKAEQIGFVLQQALAETDDESLHHIILLNTHGLVNYYDAKGWFPDALNDLKYKLTTPTKWDLPRQKHEKKILQKEFFPEEAQQALLQQNKVDTIPIGQDVFKNLKLFVVDDEIQMDKLRYLSLTSLFDQAIEKTLFLENGEINEDIDEEDFIRFGKILHDLYDIDNEFTFDFLLQALNDYYEPENQDIIAFIVADFLQQKLNLDRHNDIIEDDFYDYGSEICQRFWNNVDEELQTEIALINLHGLIENYHQSKTATQFLQEKDSFLTRYKGDSPGQVKAKEFIANEYINSSYRKPMQP